MAPVFIFTGDVEKALREGKKEIEIPEDARISAAALDLIRDQKIKVTYGDSQGEGAEPLPPTHKPARKREDEGRDRQVEGQGPVEESSPGSPGGELSEEELDEIVRRVVERLGHTEGGGAAPAAELEAQGDDDDLVICRCEEITKGEIKDAIRNGMSTTNGIKRITRAGMGLCQGQTCQRLVTQILANELGVRPSEIEPTTARAPVRPLPIFVFASG